MGKKEAPAASWVAATGLVKSRAVIFTKKSACGKLDSSNGAFQITDSHFDKKKSACGKLVSSNRACQVPDVHFAENKRLRQAG